MKTLVIVIVICSVLQGTDFFRHPQAKPNTSTRCVKCVTELEQRRIVSGMSGKDYKKAYGNMSKYKVGCSSCKAVTCPGHSDIVCFHCKVKIYKMSYIVEQDE